MDRRKLVFIKSDYSQLELRRRIHKAGGVLKLKDAFTELVSRSNGAFKEAAQSFNWTERDCFKSMAHAGGYGEGMCLIPEQDLYKHYRAMQAKALLLMPESWHYEGKRIGFTGANLAKRMFKSSTYEARARALGLQDIYFKIVPEERIFQSLILDFINTHRINGVPYIQSETTRVLKLNSGGERDVKQALSFIGAGESADFATETLCIISDYCESNNTSFWPVLFVHDEILFESYRDEAEKNAKVIKELMEAPKTRIKGFGCPVKIQKGENWFEKEMEEILI